MLVEALKLSSGLSGPQDYMIRSSLILTLDGDYLDLNWTGSGTSELGIGLRLDNFQLKMFAKVARRAESAIERRY